MEQREALWYKYRVGCSYGHYAFPPMWRMISLQYRTKVDDLLVFCCLFLAGDISPRTCNLLQLKPEIDGSGCSDLYQNYEHFDSDLSV